MRNHQSCEKRYVTEIVVKPPHDNSPLQTNMIAEHVNEHGEFIGKSNVCLRVVREAPDGWEKKNFFEKTNLGCCTDDDDHEPSETRNMTFRDDSVAPLWEQEELVGREISDEEMFEEEEEIGDLEPEYIEAFVEQTSVGSEDSGLLRMETQRSAAPSRAESRMSGTRMSATKRSASRPGSQRSQSASRTGSKR